MTHQSDSSSSPAAPLAPQDYLKKILNARVYDVAHETPLQIAPSLSQRLGNTVLLKREDKQPVFSFKLRGAYNKMAHLTPQQLQRGVICASAGNHAQGVALGARKLGTRAVIVMPTTTPQVKRDAVQALGGEVVLAGESYNDAYEHAVRLQQEQGLTFIHPFDDPDVIAGQGTIGMELLRQVQALSSTTPHMAALGAQSVPHPSQSDTSLGHRAALDAVFVAIGGGGLVAGIASYIKAVNPAIRVIGVQMADSDDMLQSVQAGKRIALRDVGLFSDGTAVKLVGEETFRLACELVDEFVVVNTDAVCAAIKDIFIDTRSIVEPAGAMGVAAIKQYVARHGCQGQTFAAVLCGANMNFDRLRFVAERAEVGEAREALFAITIPEERGSFRRLCQLINHLDGPPRNVTEFNYRMRQAEAAYVFVGLTTHATDESTRLAAQFQQQGFATLDLTDNELAKGHVRYMVGGVSPLATHERLLRFEFPERPGALMKFLNLMNPNWNISLFHYRNQGADYSQVLVGIQVPPQDGALFAQFLHTLDYPFVEETDNPVYHMFL